MESFNDFVNRNRNWDNGNILVTEEEMRANYEIARHVESTYNDRFGKVEGPRIGDIVEFSDGWHVYKNAKIVENVYDNGRLCICENGSSWTNGQSFSTSGGAFVSKEAAELQYVGEDENIVWTWGCNGTGANQGIYFPLKVSRWIIPYNNKDVKRSIVYFKKNERNNIVGVNIENTDSWMCNVMSFNSLAAFEAWAKYVGYDYYIGDDGRGYSNKKIEERCWVDDAQKPKCGKEIKVLGNGRIHDGIVICEDYAITQWWPNTSRNIMVYDTPELRAEADKEIQLFQKYAYNPMGV